MAPTPDRNNKRDKQKRDRRRKSNKSDMSILSDNSDICPVCQNSVENHDKGLNCDRCLQWRHAHCCLISDEEYEFLAGNDNVIYICDDCKSKGKNDKKEEDGNNSTILKQMKTMMETILVQHNKIIEENKQLLARVSKLEKEKPASAITEDSIKAMVEERVDEVMRETKEQEERKLNLIFVNVPENVGKDSDVKDKEMLDTLVKKILPDEEVSIEENARLGKVNIGNLPRLLKIKVKTADIKWKILKNAAKLNEGTNVTDPRKKIYVNLDYTKKEREVNKALRTELRNKSPEERSKYIIKNGKLIPKDGPAEAGGATGGTQ